MLNQKILFAIILLIFFSINSFAQEINYHLAKFQTPNLKRSSLSFDVDMDYADNYDLIDSDYETFNKHGSLDLGIRYHRYVDTQRYQQAINFIPSFGPSLDYGKIIDHGNGPNRDLAKEIHGSFIFDFNHLMYNNNGFFYGGGTELSGNTSKIFTTEKETVAGNKLENEDEQTSVSMDFSLPISVGFGRIYDAQNVRLALYILEDLQQDGYLVKVPDEKTIEEFGQRIAEIKNQRVLDSREKKKYVFKQIDSFLQEKQLITEGDINYFAILSDNVLYASNPSRKTGKRLSLEIDPSYSFYHDDLEYHDEYILEAEVVQEDSDFQATEKSWKVLGGLVFWCEKPINKYFQMTTLLAAKIGNQQSKIERTGSALEVSYDYERKAPLITPSVDLGFAYYPNSRNTLTLNLSADYVNENGTVTRDNDPEEDYLYEATYGKALLNWDHYLSMRSKIKMTYTFLLNYTVESNNRNTVVEEIKTSDRFSTDNKFDISYSYDVF